MQYAGRFVAEVPRTTGKKENEPPVLNRQELVEKKVIQLWLVKAIVEFANWQCSFAVVVNAGLPSQKSFNDGQELISFATNVMFIFVRLVTIVIVPQMRVSS